MQIVVFAIQFRDGAWMDYQHNCSNEETEAVIESSKAKAFERFRHRTPNHADYLAASSYLFNVARGTADKPAEGDTLVLEVQGDDELSLTTAETEQALEYA
jgi:hypothetical protein